MFNKCINHFLFIGYDELYLNAHFRNHRGFVIYSTIDAVGRCRGWIKMIVLFKPILVLLSLLERLPEAVRQGVEVFLWSPSFYLCLVFLMSR